MTEIKRKTKKRMLLTDQLNVRVAKSVIKEARSFAKKSKTRLGQIVESALSEYLTNVKK